MNPEQLLNLVERAMLACADHTAYRFIIYVAGGCVYCMPARDAREDGVVIVRLTRHQLKKGLTSSEWNTVADSITKIWKELGL